MEDAAEVVGRDRQSACELWQRAPGLCGEHRAGAIHKLASGPGRRRSAGGDVSWIGLPERLGGHGDRSLCELVRVGATMGGGEQQPVGDVEPRRDRQGGGGERLIVAPQRGDKCTIQSDCRAVVAVRVGVVEALLLARLHAVGQRRVEQRLDSVHAADEAAAAHEHEGVAGAQLDRVAAPARVPACEVLDRDAV